jgi:ribulose kinase
MRTPAALPLQCRPVGPQFVGVDVGTGSVRAGVFDLGGACRGMGVAPISIAHPRGGWAEQSSEEIWEATGRAVREAVARSGASADDVHGIAFDATCSLVVLGDAGRPLSVDSAGAPDRNVVVWMDHRATEQAERLTRSGAEALRYVGGTLSPEMEVPKLAWLRENAPRTFDAIWKVQDLADHLVWRASGADVRSVCTLGCKWGWLAHERRFDERLWHAAGIESLLEGGRTGDRVGALGERAGSLTAAVASHLGLRAGCAVAVGIIDAHAGGLGALAGSAPVDEQIAIIAGTSACHMAVSKDPRFVPGVWGPYHGAMVPGMWLSEGGQSAAGALLDHLVKTDARSAAFGDDPHASIAASDVEAPADLHVLPYFHGNRSPRADPRAKGTIAGLALDASPEAFARVWAAAVAALAYGTRHIVETMNAHGHRIRAAHLCGGLARNARYVRDHADALGLPVRVVREPDAMLLGGAMLAATAAGARASVAEAMASMGAKAETVVPRPERKAWHDARYRTFLRMYEDALAYRGGA